MNKRPRDGMRTSAALRRAIRRSSQSIRSIARQYHINPKTAAKWRRRESIDDLKTGPKKSGSSVLTIEAEAIIVAFREHLALPLNDCLSALQPIIPHLTRSTLHRCLQRHGISVRTAPNGAMPFHAGVEPETFGHFSVRATEILLSQRKLQLFVAVEHSSKFVFVQLREHAASPSGADFLSALIESVPGKVHSVFAQGGAALQMHAFRDFCTDHDIKLRPGARDPWNEEQHRRINSTLRQAMDRPWQQHDLTLLRQKLARAVAAYNRGCRLQTLNGLTPQEFARALDERPGLQVSRRATQSWDATSRPTPRANVRIAARPGNPRVRDPGSTREAILEAARSCLAHDGPEGLSLAEVARIAGVNRGTAYKHFKTREKLIAATADWVSDKLFDAVFGSPGQVASRRLEEIDVAELTDRLANFAMDNPELCRAWLLKVLSSPNPSGDRFWREYQGSTAQFALTNLAQNGVDAEVLSVIMLAGAFLWPVWARAHSRGKEDMRPLAYRFAQECLRISMYGNLRSEHYPEIAARLRGWRPEDHRI